MLLVDFLEKIQDVIRKDRKARDYFSGSEFNDKTGQIDANLFMLFPNAFDTIPIAVPLCNQFNPLEIRFNIFVKQGDDFLQGQEMMKAVSIIMDALDNSKDPLLGGFINDISWRLSDVVNSTQDVLKGILIASFTSIQYNSGELTNK